MTRTIPDKMDALQLRVYEGVAALTLAQKAVPRPGRGQVLVRMVAAPVNPSDLSFLEGHYGVTKRLPVVPGFEGSGTVVAAGPGLFGRLLLGRRVACAAHPREDGSWAGYMRTRATMCAPLLKEVSLEQGATLIINPLTAWALVQLARRAGHKALLQTAAAGALGRMILRLGQRFDLTVVHVVRRPAQVDLLHALGAGHVLDSSEPEFDARLQEQCHELNVRLALDAVAGKMTGRLLDAMPRHSKAIVYGGLSGQAVRVDPRRLIFADQRVDGFWLADWMGHKGMLDWLLTVYRVQKALAAELKTEVQERYPLREGVAAIRHYMDNMTEGKVLLLPGEARALERSRRPL